VITAARLIGLMNQDWPAAHSTELDGWLVRRTAGVTLRANPVLPANGPFDLGKALDYVESLYLAHGITPSFQISPAARPADLDAQLEARGYEVRTPTLVQCAEIADALAKLPEPTVEMNIPRRRTPVGWTSGGACDGHGRGADDQAAARQILTAARPCTPSPGPAARSRRSGGSRSSTTGPGCTASPSTSASAAKG